MYAKYEFKRHSENQDQQIDLIIWTKPLTNNELGRVKNIQSLTTVSRFWKQHSFCVFCSFTSEEADKACFAEVLVIS